MKLFGEDIRGEIHLVHPLDLTYSLCGSSGNLGCELNELDNFWKLCKNSEITCIRCVEIITACRSKEVNL